LRGSQAVVAYAAGWRYSWVATDNVVTQMLTRLSKVEVLHGKCEVPWPNILDVNSQEGFSSHRVSLSSNYVLHIHSLLLVPPFIFSSYLNLCWW
jgi:hypothetical protein